MGAAFSTLFFLVRFLCHVLAHFRPAIDAVVNLAVTNSTITSGQRTTVNNWLDAASVVCTILTEIEF